MATYKVIQDIEAEDKLLGPLTLRQFIYAAIVIVMGFIAFKLAMVTPFLVIPFLPPMIFFGMLAAPFGHDQSSEVWLLAKIRFFLKPRLRIWDQTGVQELVTITVPKQVEKHLTDGLSQTEVKSRLRALASTIDSRGWVVKNVNVNMYSQPSYLAATGATVTTASDRLVDNSNLPQEVPTYEVYAADDILDETNNPTAQHLDTMINQSEQAHHEALVATVQAVPTTAQPPADYWFMSQSAGPVVAPGTQPTDLPTGQTSSGAQATTASTADEQALLDNIHLENTRPNPAYGHTRVVSPLGTQRPTTVSRPKQATDSGSQTAKTVDDKAVIARLAGNDDLNVATIAREADKAVQKPLDEEVTVSLR